jgi:hypothetical protein
MPTMAKSLSLIPPPIRGTRPSAHTRGYGGRAWDILRRQCFERDYYRCQECGKVTIPNSPDPGRRPHCDHTIAKVDGGPDTLDNVRTLCGSCHNSHTVKSRTQHASNAYPYHCGGDRGSNSLSPFSPKTVAQPKILFGEKSKKFPSDMVPSHDAARGYVNAETVKNDGPHGGVEAICPV